MSYTSLALTALTEHLPAVQAASAALMTGIIDMITVITRPYYCSQGSTKLSHVVTCCYERCFTPIPFEAIKSVTH